MTFALLVYKLDISALQAFYKVKYRPVSMASLWLLNRNFVIKSYSIWAGVAKVRILELTSVIFYCFESSVCSHFVNLVSISSNVVIHFTHPKLQFNILKPRPSPFCCSYNSWLTDLWNTKLLSDLSYKFINGSFAFSCG